MLQLLVHCNLPTARNAASNFETRWFAASCAALGSGAREGRLRDANGPLAHVAPNHSQLVSPVATLGLWSWPAHECHGSSELPPERELLQLPFLNSAVPLSLLQLLFFQLEGLKVFTAKMSNKSRS